MLKLTNATPKLRKHKATGQAVVTIAGRDHYLGRHGTKAAQLEYDRLIGEWLAAGRPARQTMLKSDITVAEVAAGYLRFAKRHDRNNGEITGTIYGVKVAFSVLAKEVFRPRTVTERMHPQTSQNHRRRTDWTHRHRLPF